MNNYQLSEAAIAKNKRPVNQSLRSLQQELEQENTLISETPVVKFQKVLDIYRSIKAPAHGAGPAAARAEHVARGGGDLHPGPGCPLRRQR